VADNLLVLRNGSQVGFGPADEMINAVRNLQVVAGSKPSDDNADAQEVVAKEATNDAPVSASATNTADITAAQTAPSQPGQADQPMQAQAVPSPISEQPEPSTGGLPADTAEGGSKPSSNNTPGAPS
jgi:ABC-type multidrug transport system ATPase subunit